LHSYSLCLGFPLSPPPLNNRLDMIFRIATLNLEQNHKCWEARRELILQQWGELGPDMLALNEIYLPEQTGRWLQRGAVERLHMRYTLLQQSKVGEDSHTQAEGLLTRYPVIETANLDYRSHNCVALAARFEIDGRFLDVYVLMSGAFRPTQIQPTAFTPLQEPAGSPSHPEWERFDRCIDYIWVTESIKVQASGLCFNRPAPDNPALWPSDHVGVWADLELS
jgi:endonuclease/exonuclease/phosphatase family metal-dependent hydrolase